MKVKVCKFCKQNPHHEDCEELATSDEARKAIRKGVITQRMFPL